MLAACTATFGSWATAETNGAPVWADRAPLTKQSVVLDRADGSKVRIDVLGERLFRVRHSKSGAWTESAMNRYGVLSAACPETAYTRQDTGETVALSTRDATLTVSSKDGSITLSTASGDRLTRQASPTYAERGGYDVRFSLAKDERIYGLGDSSRDTVMRRGWAYDIWVLNVTSYIPVPMTLSSRGWGLLMNTTWRNRFDVGKSDPDAMICTAPRSDLDYYLFCGKDYRSLLDTYTSFTGRPALLPIWGYAFTYVCNQNIDAFNLVNEALEFRRQQMPCDVIGLEPGWMEKFYDQSTQKKWHPQRFPIPYWAPKGPHTFIGALARKGFKLSLWLCCDYDLGVYEEQCVAGKKAEAAPEAGKTQAGAPEVWHDDRIEQGKTSTSGAKKEQPPDGTEPWF